MFSMDYEPPGLAIQRKWAGRPWLTPSSANLHPHCGREYAEKVMLSCVSCDGLIFHQVTDLCDDGGFTQQIPLWQPGRIHVVVF